MTGSASGLGSVTYCGVASTGQTAQYTDNGDNTGTLVFNVMLPTGPNQNNQNWRFNGAFNGNVSPVTITGNGNQSAQYGVGDDTDDWQATGG